MSGHQPPPSLQNPYQREATTHSLPLLSSLPDLLSIENSTSSLLSLFLFFADAAAATAAVISFDVKIEELNASRDYIVAVTKALDCMAPT